MRNKSDDMELKWDDGAVFVDGVHSDEEDSSDDDEDGEVLVERKDGNGTKALPTATQKDITLEADTLAKKEETTISSQEKETEATKDPNQQTGNDPELKANTESTEHEKQEQKESGVAAGAEVAATNTTGEACTCTRGETSEETDTTSDQNSEPPAEDEAKPKPTLWQSAGRSIKKNSKVGKFVLNGIRDSYRGTKKMLGIGTGEIHICFPETNVFEADEVVKGTVSVKLTEPIQASCLKICLKGVREAVVRDKSTGSTHTEQKNVYMMDYDIGGKREYSCQEDAPFEVLVPRLRKKMSDETRKSVMGSLISSVQSIASAAQAPIQWSLTATLVIPGRLNMSKTVRIHVAEEEY